MFSTFFQNFLVDVTYNFKKMLILKYFYFNIIKHFPFQNIDGLSFDKKSSKRET